MSINYFLGSLLGVDVGSVSAGEGTPAFGLSSVSSLDPGTVRVVFTEEVLSDTSQQTVLTIPVFDPYNFVITEQAGSVPVHRGQEVIRVLRVKKVNDTTFDLITNAQTNTWYDLQIFNIYDIYGNLVDPALDSLPFFGTRHDYLTLADEMRVLPLTYQGGDSQEVTDFLPDQSLPILQNQDPAPETIDVVQTTPIQLEIIDVGEGVNAESVTLTVDGENALLGGQQQSGYTVTETVITSGFHYKIQPQNQFYEGSYVTIGVYAEDNSHLPMALNTSYRFATTATPPYLQNQSPPPDDVRVNPFKTVYFEVVDPNSGINDASVIVRINGINAVINNVAQNGHTFEKLAITNGYSYRFRVPSETGLPNGITSVLVIADNGAEVAYTLSETYYFEVDDSPNPPELSVRPNRFNVPQIDIVGTQIPKTVWNQYDEHGLVVSLNRLEGETNWEYRRRLTDSMVHVANSSYRGIVHGLTRELGLALSQPVLINPRTDGDGRFLAADPYIRFDGAYVYLYSDYKNNRLDWAIDRHEAGGNYEHLVRLVDFINTTAFFEAAILPGFDHYTRSMSLMNQSNRVLVPGETIPASTRFRLNNSRIVRNSLTFTDRLMFKNEMTSADLVDDRGQYHIDYHNGIVTVGAVPESDISVRYQYTTYPFKPIASPVIVCDITNDNFRSKMFQQIQLDDGTYAHGIPKEVGVDIINELLTVVPMYWGL